MASAAVASPNSTNGSLSSISNAYNDLSSLPPFTMTFSLYLSCESCVESVQTAVKSVPGITSAEASLEKQTLKTQGTAAPSSIVSAIQSTGRDAVVRGTGLSSGFDGSCHAAVAILEDYDTPPVVYTSSPVVGLMRVVQVTFPPQDDEALSVIDITFSGVAPGEYTASIRASGDISKGSRSVGAAWKEIAGVITVGKDGKGSAVVVGRGWEVWEIVGRAFAVERVRNGTSDVAEGECPMVLGVIARSAGVWDNEKMVCSCSGKTVWEERGEQKARGML